MLIDYQCFLAFTVISCHEYDIYTYVISSTYLYIYTVDNRNENQYIHTVHTYMYQVTTAYYTHKKNVLGRNRYKVRYY